MRTVVAVLTGVLVHALMLSVAVSQLLTIEVVSEGSTQPSEESSLASWLVMASLFVVATLVGGTAAGAIAKGRWVLASCLVGAWGAAQLFLNGQGAAGDALTVVIVGAVLCVPAALLGAHTLMRFVPSQLANKP